jgi:hypothetical protein
MIHDTTIIGRVTTPTPINKSIPRDANSITPKVYQSPWTGETLLHTHTQSATHV